MRFTMAIGATGGEAMQKSVRLMAWLALAMAIIPFADAAAEMKRLALVIGNSKYEVAGALPNAARDATSFGEFLSSQGFEVDVVTDASRREMASAVSLFAKKVGPEDVALLYFAGHGMQLHGENFLVGTDAHLESELDVPAETVALTDVIGAVEKKAKIALFFLDACRNNPLANRLNEQVEGVSRSLATRGLAPVNTEAAGTMVAFAAAPGQVAADGSGENSPFTTALIANLSGPGLEIGTAFKRVIRDVRNQTSGKQSPQILSSLALEFYFNASLPVATKDLEAKTDDALSTPVADTKADAVEADFRKALRINTPRIWKAFINKHRIGEYPEVARQMLAQMQPAQTTARASTPEQREALVAGGAAGRKRIQLVLAGKGFDPGSADGAFGKQTRNAISAYQRSERIAETGFLNSLTLSKLGVQIDVNEDGIYSSPRARSYKPEDFIGLENDARVLKALACFPYYERIYGAFGGHLYMVLRSGNITRASADRIAGDCGGHLATIGSQSENDFLADMMNGDQRTFLTGYDVKYATSYKMGAWIGLVQASTGAEPRGGWGWVTGEPLTYTNWYRDMPNEHNKGDDFGMFYAHGKGKTDFGSLVVTNWDDMGPSDSTNSLMIEFE